MRYVLGFTYTGLPTGVTQHWKLDPSKHRSNTAKTIHIYVIINIFHIFVDSNYLLAIWIFKFYINIILTISSMLCLCQRRGHVSSIMFRIRIRLLELI